VEEGVTYPVVALYDPTLNYKDICKSVKDFTAAIHIDQAVLDANPNMTVTLELVMTNPNNANDTMQIGEDYIYRVKDLTNFAAKNLATETLYTSAQEAINAANPGETVVLIRNLVETSITVKNGRIFDLNGFTLRADLVATITNSEIIDSTNGNALLVIEKTGLAVATSAPTHLPVWTEDGEAGYRFTSIEFVQRVSLKNADRAYFRFWFAGDVGNDPESMLAKALADGGADNGITVEVQLTWKDAGGQTVNKSFVFTEENVQTYANDWTGKMFYLYINGVESAPDLTVSAKVVSSFSETEVSVSSEAITPVA